MYLVPLSAIYFFVFFFFFLLLPGDTQTNRRWRSTFAHPYYFSLFALPIPRRVYVCIALHIRLFDPAREWIVLVDMLETTVPKKWNFTACDVNTDFPYVFAVCCTRIVKFVVYIYIYVWKLLNFNIWCGRAFCNVELVLLSATGILTLTFFEYKECGL